MAIFQPLCHPTPNLTLVIESSKIASQSLLGFGTPADCFGHLIDGGSNGYLLRKSYKLFGSASVSTVTESLLAYEIR